jgi:radical SAM protein with 4Fe4S-binding SPASM domain
MATLHCRRYPDEHYLTLFNPDTGFFVRAEEPGYGETFWSAHGPEMLDVSITSWCGRECGICYRAAGRHGYHMLLSDYENVIQQAARLGALQVALGGGNPNEHPQFTEILRLTRCGYGVVPNYTTNGHGLSDSVLRSSAEYCGAVAISAYEPYTCMAEAIDKLAGVGMRTNVHFVLDAESVGVALAWLRDPPGFLQGVNAIIFLNYKPVGRGANEDRCLCLSETYRTLIKEATTRTHGFKVGFDSCMVSGLVTEGQVDPVWFDACEAARFTMFVSEQLELYPCSFMETICPGIPLTASNMLDVWQHGATFQATRRSLREPTCSECTMQGICHGGCPVLPQINLCRNPKRRSILR